MTKTFLREFFHLVVNFTGSLKNAGELFLIIDTSFQNKQKSWVIKEKILLCSFENEADKSTHDELNDKCRKSY